MGAGVAPMLGALTPDTWISIKLLAIQLQKGLPPTKTTHPKTQPAYTHRDRQTETKRQREQ